MEILKNTFALYRRCAPQLIAIYLVGWLARYGVVQLAVFVGVRWGALPGNLVLPLSTLIMLLTYLGMFWVLHPTDANGDGRTSVQDFLEVTIKVMLPAFAILIIWKLHMKDMLDYQIQRDTEVTLGHLGDRASQEQLLNIGTVTLVVVVAILLAIRKLISLAEDRLPRWAMPVRLYFESAWLYMLFVASAAAIFASPTWLRQRQIVTWYNEQKQGFLEHFKFIAHAMEWLTSLTEGTGKAILLPLSWFIIAGLAYTHMHSSTWSDALRATLGPYHEKVVDAAQKSLSSAQSQWQRTPDFIRNRTGELRAGILGSFDHVRDAAKLAFYAGPIQFAFYLFLFAILVLLFPTGTYFDVNVTDGILWRAVVTILGPHRLEWWVTNESAIRLGIGTLIEPIRICLISAMYWYCVEQLKRSSDRADTT